MGEWRGWLIKQVRDIARTNLSIFGRTDDLERAPQSFVPPINP